MYNIYIYTSLIKCENALIIEYFFAEYLPFLSTGSSNTAAPAHLCDPPPHPLANLVIFTLL